MREQRPTSALWVGNRSSSSEPHSSDLGHTSSLADPIVLLHGDDAAIGHRDNDIDAIARLRMFLTKLQNRTVLAAWNQRG